MKRLLWIWVGLVGALLAYRVEVKQNDVTLQINDLTIPAHPGKHFELSAGDVVCYKQGAGRITIVGKTYKKQLTSHHVSTCVKLPSEDGKPVAYAKKIRNAVVSFLADAHEERVDGISRKDAKLTKQEAVIELPAQAQFLEVSSKRWGPLPVTLKITDANGTVKETIVNEEETGSAFIVTRDLVSGGCSLTVCNAFDDVMLHAKIKEKK
jgi:hypothetical protein